MKRVGLFPFGGPENPYTRMLADTFRAMGYQVTPLRDTKFFPLRRAASSSVDALHILWLGNLYRSSTRLGTVAKRLMFSDGLGVLGRVRSVYSADNLIPHDSPDPEFDLRMTQLLVDRVSAVTVATGAAESVFRSTYRLPPDVRVFHVPHRSYIGEYPDSVTRAEAREYFGMSAGARVVLSLGRIVPYKGLVSLVDAFLAADLGDSVLMIAGQEKVPGTVDSIKRRVSRARRSADVRVYDGFIPDTEVQYFLRAADVLALPYQDVPMNPGSVILGMSFGVPILSVRDGSIPEILDEGFFEFPRGDLGAQVSAIQSAFSDKERIVELGRRGRRIAELRHSVEAVSLALLDCYSHVFT